MYFLYSSCITVGQGILVLCILVRLWILLSAHMWIILCGLSSLKGSLYLRSSLTYWSWFFHCLRVVVNTMLAHCVGMTLLYSSSMLFLYTWKTMDFSPVLKVSDCLKHSGVDLFIHKKTCLRINCIFFGRVLLFLWRKVYFDVLLSRYVILKPQKLCLVVLNPFCLLPEMQVQNFPFLLDSFSHILLHDVWW